jgi:hypothetical protein
MTEAEMLAWLGLPDPLPPGRRLRPDIAEALAGIPAPAPGDNEAFLRAFSAFLKVVGPAPRVLVTYDEEGRRTATIEEEADGRAPGS